MAPNHVWTYGFMFAATFGEWLMKVLSIVDEFGMRPGQYNVMLKKLVEGNF